MEQRQRGHLKIFFSYGESIGKTMAMLKAAQAVSSQGVDVLIGCISSNLSGEAISLLDGFRKLSPIVIEGREEFDLDQALYRKPDLILIDELAHSNGTGCRHRRRYQDIDELLQAGIDVYTTVNVGNIESLYDTVTAITGMTAWERIPDSVFDQADQVELIDIEPQELIERLKGSDTPDSLFTVEQLTALRETALRRCADRVRRLPDKERKNSFHTDEHILVCLSSAPSNAKIIRTAARMAGAFNSQFTALFVETPDFGAATAENRQRLRDNQELAERLGAHIETVFGEDVPYQIAEFARLSGITKIVLGRSTITRKHFPGKLTLTVKQHCIDQGSCLMPCRRMHHHPLGLVNNQKICIFIKDGKGNILCYDLQFLQIRHLQFHQIFFFHPVAGFYLPAIYQHTAVFDQLLKIRSGLIRQHGMQKLICPLLCMTFVHRQTDLIHRLLPFLLRDFLQTVSAGPHPYRKRKSKAQKLPQQRLHKYPPH